VKQKVGPLKETAERIVEHCFRRESGRLVAVLSNLLGLDNIATAEDIVQDTFLTALRVWPQRGFPDNPSAWLLTVARNKAYDHLRRSAKAAASTDAATAIREGYSAEQSDASGYRDEVQDDLLRMIFALCHPSLPREAQLVLILKILCGFSVDEIAHAFLAQPQTIAQRIVRAKRAIRENNITLTVPDPGELVARLSGVMETIYLLFNEGYSSYGESDPEKKELCEEAIRLSEILVFNRRCEVPELYALRALLFFHAARLPGRFSAENELLLLQEQDRKSWNREYLASGFACLEKAMIGQTLTAYHLEAGIAACHAAAKTFEETDWKRIAFYYDLLHEMNPSPVIALNRAVARAFLLGPDAGLQELWAVAESKPIHRYHLFFAARGELYRQKGDFDLARTDFERALELARIDPERRFLQTQIDRCGSCDA
jgi:RNA polymerase sigma factor (sigma-70 family)